MALGTTAALIGSSVIGAVGANKAAKSQAGAAGADLALQGRIYDETTERFQPFTQGGVDAFNALLSLYGLADAPMIGGSPAEIETIGRTLPNGRVSPVGKSYQVGGQTFTNFAEAEAYAAANPVGGTPWAGLELSDATRFAMDEGRDSIEAGAAGAGGLYSGATMEGLERLRFGLAANDRETQVNRLYGLAGMGQASAGGQAAAGSAYAAGASNAYGNLGNARAAGAIGVGNAVNQGLGNYVGYQQYNALLPLLEAA